MHQSKAWAYLPQFQCNYRHCSRGNLVFPYALYIGLFVVMYFLSLWFCCTRLMRPYTVPNHWNNRVKSTSTINCYFFAKTFSFPGTRVRIQPKIQRRQIHHRASAHDQRKRLGLTVLNAMSESDSATGTEKDSKSARAVPCRRISFKMAVLDPSGANI